MFISVDWIGKLKISPPSIKTGKISNDLFKLEIIYATHSRTHRLN